MRFYEVTAAAVDQSDQRFDGFTVRRQGMAGLGWHFTSLVEAETEKQAEAKFRKLPRFRRTARLASADWRTVAVFITPTTADERIDPEPTESQLDQLMELHVPEFDEADFEKEFDLMLKKHLQAIERLMS